MATPLATELLKAKTDAVASPPMSVTTPQDVVRLQSPSGMISADAPQMRGELWGRHHQSVAVCASQKRFLKLGCTLIAMIWIHRECSEHDFVELCWQL